MNQTWAPPFNFPPSYLVSKATLPWLPPPNPCSLFNPDLSTLDPFTVNNKTQTCSNLQQSSVLAAQTAKMRSGWAMLGKSAPLASTRSLFSSQVILVNPDLWYTAVEAILNEVWLAMQRSPSTLLKTKIFIHFHANKKRTSLSEHSIS